MKFEEIYINGFGIFHDYHITNISPGINIFLGKNEAGKSTILNFIQRILFGFPDKRSKLNIYPALCGGRHGGRLIISTDAGKRYVIERYSDTTRNVKVISSDGLEGGNDELARILGYVNKDIFENIYAFGLTELQDFATLDNETIRARLYSAGTGVGNISLGKLQKDIEEEAAKLFKPQGTKPEINALVREIKEIDKQQKTQDDIREFDSLYEKMEKITEEIEILIQKKNTVKNKLMHVQNLIRAYEDWIRLNEAKDKLKSIPDIKNFPENGIEMLERHMDKIDELNKDIDEKKTRLNEIRLKKQQIVVNEILLKNKSRIIELQKGQDKYKADMTELTRLEGEIEKNKDELKKLLKNIGGRDWDEHKLSEFDVSIHVKEMVKEKGRIIKQIEEKIKEITQCIEMTNKGIKDINNKIDQINTSIEMYSTGYNRDVLNKQQAALQRMRVRYPELKIKEEKLRDEDNILVNLYQRISIPKLPVWPGMVFIGAGIIAIILSIVSNTLFSGIVILTILGISAGIYFVMVRKSKIYAQQEILAKRREEIDKEYQKLKEDMINDAKICGFDIIPDNELIEAKVKELYKLEELIQQKDTLQKELKQKTEEKNEYEMRLSELKDEKQTHQKEWEDWLTEKQIDVNITPEGMLEILFNIETCIGKKFQIEKLSVQMRRIQQEIEQYRNNVLNILEICNIEKSKDIIVALEMLIDELNRMVENNESLKQIDIEEKNLVDEIHRLYKRVEKEQEEISYILSAGSAKNEVEFRNNAEYWHNRKRLIDEIRQREENIKKITGIGKVYDNFIRELEAQEQESLTMKEVHLKDELVGIEEELSKVTEQKGGIVERIKQIESSDKSSVLRNEKAIKLQQLYQKSKEWAVLMLAKAIMHKAIERYEKERKPGVIKSAQTFFSRFTINKYTQIYAPLGETRIYVEDNTGLRKELQELSRGCTEQLYLALRLGFIYELNKRAEHLPVIFDDILVNFDPDRLYAACETIKELSKSNQVLYFTCHPETAKILHDITHEARVVNI